MARELDWKELDALRILLRGSERQRVLVVEKLLEGLDLEAIIQMLGRFFVDEPRDLEHLIEELPLARQVETADRESSFVAGGV